MAGASGGSGRNGRTSGCTSAPRAAHGDEGQVGAGQQTDDAADEPEEAADHPASVVLVLAGRRPEAALRMAALIGRVSSLSSIGTIHFVLSPAASALSASRYWSAIVFSSMPFAALKIVSSALAEALGAQDLRLPIALGAKDVRLLVALGHVDRRLARALRLGDDRASVALGRHLAVHRLLDVARRHDLADLDVRDLHAPALGHLVELGAQDVVDLLALGQHVVERDVADDGAQRRRRQRLAERR